MLNLDFVHPQDALQIAELSQKDLFTDEPLGVPEIFNAVVLPGGWQGGYGGVREGEEAQEFLGQVETHYDESVVYVGEMLSTWGHCITDLLRHFWFVTEPQFAHLKKLKIAYTMHFQNDEIPPNFYELLALLGFEKTQFLRINTISTFKSIFVPDGCYRVKNFLEYYRYTREYPQLLNAITQHAKPLPNYQKVYFSRTQISQKTPFLRRRDVGEETLEKIFQEAGFKIIYPEKLPFAEQLNILQSCEVFAATDGSIAHNLLFCRDGISALIIRKSRHFTLHQITVNAVKNANVTYIDAGFSPYADQKAHWWAGPFFVYESPEISRFFKRPPKRFPWLRYFIFYCGGQWARQFLENEKMLQIRRRLKLGTRLKKLFKR